MSTKIYSSQDLHSLQPATALWQLYHPENAPYRFQAASLVEARAWQQAVRPVLAAQVGFQDLPRPDLEPQTIKVVDKGDYTRTKVLLRISTHISLPVYLLIPKAARPPYPSMLAFHGHGYGVKDIVGLWEDGSERDSPDGYHKDFAVALCRRGFAVAAPEISCFGERQNDYTYLKTPLGSPIPTTCDHIAMLALYLGGTALGLRIFDSMRLVDYLQTRPEFDTARLGAMGISGGGMHTFFSACLDERIRACVVSGYYSTFRDSILAMEHCRCNFVPGLWQFGEMYDLVGLIAPRPLLVEAGTYDNIFPIAAVKASVARAREIYSVFDADATGGAAVPSAAVPSAAVLGAASAFETDYFEGRHAISGARAYDFLYEHLSAT